jgi:hypothetical protein
VAVSEVDGQRDPLLATAMRIGDGLLASAEAAGKGWTWATRVRRADGTVVDRHDRSILRGVPGIAYFLLELHAASGESAHLEACRRAIEWLVANPCDPITQDCSLYGGALGTALVCLEVFKRTGSEEYLGKALRIVKAARAEMVESARYDNSLCFGRSGMALFLARLHHAFKEDWLLELLYEVLGGIVNTALLDRKGVFWIADDSVPQAARGLALGSAGPALALTQIGAYLGEQDLVELGGSILALLPTYENDSWFDGSAGVGLGCLSSYRLLRDETHLEALRRTARVQSAGAATGGDTLLHGELGALLFLNALAGEPGFESCRGLARLRLTRLIERGPAGLEGNGLFTGVTGLGLACLQVLAGSSAPGILFPECCSGGPAATAAPSAGRPPRLSAGLIVHSVLGRAFPRTFQLLQRLDPDATRMLTPSALPRDMASWFEARATTLTSKMTPRTRARLADVLERERAAFDLIDSGSDCSDLARRRSIKFQEICRLVSLDDAALRQESLVIDGSVVLRTSRWNWSRSDGSAQVQETTPERCVFALLPDRGVTVGEQPLDDFGAAVLDLFKGPRTVDAGLRAYTRCFPRSERRHSARIEAIGLTYTRTLIRTGLLVPAALRERTSAPSTGVTRS